MNNRSSFRVALALAGMLAAAAALALPPAQPISLATATGELAGTLQLPDGGGKPFVALLIAGSGPTDRDGNGPAGRNDSLRLLAVQLAEAGYASVRYDKRGIGASRAAGPAESALRFDTYVDDAAAWLARLKGDARFAAPFVIGHSEGSLIGMAAARHGNAVAFISLAGPAEAAGTVIRQQLAGKLPPHLAADSERILKALEAGRMAGEVPAELNMLYRPSVQPYLVSWFRHVPAERIAALPVPVLVVQGTTDIQVGVAQARALKAARPDADLALVPGMNHVLKQVSADPAEQAASYANPELPLHPALLPRIAAFLQRSLPARR